MYTALYTNVYLLKRRWRKACPSRMFRISSQLVINKFKTSPEYIEILSTFFKTTSDNFPVILAFKMGALFSLR